MLLLTGFLFATFSEVRTGSTSDYSAVFKDASRLETGDTVRVAGIRVGTVQDVSLQADRDVLVKFDAHEARANLAAAQASLRDTQSQYQRSRELYRSKALSEADLIQLEAKMLSSQAAVDAAQARVDDTVIKAPFGIMPSIASVERVRSVLSAWATCSMSDR